MWNDRWALLASARYEIIILGLMGHYSLTTTIKKRCEGNNQINGPVSWCMRRKRTIICNYIIFMFHHLGWIKRLLKKFNLQFFFQFLETCQDPAKYLIILFLLAEVVLIFEVWYYLRFYTCSCFSTPTILLCCVIVVITWVLINIC